MNSIEELKAYLEERNTALVNLDFSFVRKYLPGINEAAIPVTLHKVRMHVATMPVQLRLESIEWLRQHGYSDMHGLPLPPPGELPK